MRLFEYLGLALYEIWHNKVRTFLTLIGIVIGIGAVIIIVSVVQGAETFLLHEIEKIAPTDIMQVYTRWDTQTEKPMIEFSEEEIAFLRQRFSDQISAITPMYRNNLEMRYQNKTQACTLISTDAFYQTIYGLNLAEGRFLSDYDVQNYNQVVVLGSEIVEEFFPKENPIGQKVQIWDSSFTVVGVLHKDEQSLLIPVSMNDGRIYMPYTVWERFNGVRNWFSLLLKVRDRSLMRPLLTGLISTIDERYGQTEDGRSKISAWDSASELDQVGIIKLVLTILLSGVAGITLLVAGIGVMNIMLVIVAERTKEIGIRKALGGTRLDILTQIIIEAIILCLFGGVFGVMLGYVGSDIAFNIAQNYFSGVEMVIPTWAIFLSLIFTTSIGLFFGIYPAFKAANLDPIEALHYE